MENTTIHRHKTAIRRGDFSRPVKCLLRDGLIGKNLTFFDYGCGRGEDIELLTAEGIECSGWDPAYRPDAPRQEADVVNLGYVINVIENPEERAATLRSAWDLCRLLLVVSAQVLVAGRGKERVALEAPTRPGQVRRAVQSSVGSTSPQTDPDAATRQAHAAADVQVVDLGVVAIGPAVLQGIEQGLERIVQVTPPVVGRMHVDGDGQGTGQGPHAPGRQGGLHGPAEGPSAPADERATADATPVVVDRRKIREFQIEHQRFQGGVPLVDAVVTTGGASFLAYPLISLTTSPVSARFLQPTRMTKGRLWSSTESLGASTPTARQMADSSARAICSLARAVRSARLSEP